MYATINPDIGFYENIVIANVDYDLNGINKSLDNIGSVGAPMLKTATMATMILSVAASVALIKIF